MELELGLKLLIQSLPAIAQIFTAFQEEKLAIIKHQQAKELRRVNYEVNGAIAQENLDFNRGHFEQDKSLQQTLTAPNNEPQLKLDLKHQPTELQLPASHQVTKNWPLRLLPSQILKSHSQDNSIPLRILLLPPKAPVNRFGEVAQLIPEIEQILAQALGEFLGNNYSLSNPERPTEFLANAWTSKHVKREASIKLLFEMLKSEPTLILESEIIGDSLNFRIAYWGLGQKTYCYKTIVSRLNTRIILEESAKRRALKWKETANRLLACGENPEEVKRLGGDNCLNLELLEKEEKWKSYGIETSDLALDYKINRKDFEELCQFLITCHCLVAGWIADAHHLIHYNVPPRLPELLPELTKNASNQQLVQEVIKTTLLGYKDIFKFLEIERPLWVPHLALNLAQSLAGLPDKSWAKEQIEYSIRSWLKQRNWIQQDEGLTLAAMQSALRIEDEQYVKNLKECFAAIGDEETITQVNNYLNLLEELKLQPKRESVALIPFGDAQSITQVDSPLSALAKSTPEGVSQFCSASILGAQSFAPLQGIPLQKRDVPNPGFVNPKRQLSLETVSLTHTLTGHSGKASSIAISCDGRTIASSSDDNTIKLLYLDTGELLHTFKGDLGRILTIALSPDGQILASSNRISDRSCIKIWQLSTGKLLHTLTGHHKWIYSLAISPDGQTLVSGSQKIKIWQLSTGKLLHTLTGHKKWIYSLAISPDGQTFVSGSGDKTIKIWHLHSGELLRTLTGHSEWVRTVAISPDGQVIASGGDDNTIKLWHLGTGNLLRTLTGHSDWVLSVAISPDGETVISGSKDNTIKIWHLSTGKLLCSLTGHKKWVYSLAVSPDGQTVASGSEDKTIKIWRAQ